MKLQTFLLLEIGYVVYVLRYFKTCYSFDFRNLNLTGYLYHLNKTSQKPESHICPFGQDMSLLLAIYLIYRLYLYHTHKKINININKTVLLIVFLLSLLNYNAVVYLIPFFIMELILIYIVNDSTSHP